MRFHPKAKAYLHARTPVSPPVILCRVPSSRFQLHLPFPQSPICSNWSLPLPCPGAKPNSASSFLCSFGVSYVTSLCANPHRVSGRLNELIYKKCFVWTWPLSPRVWYHYYFRCSSNIQVAWSQPCFPPPRLHCKQHLFRLCCPLHLPFQFSNHSFLSVRL